jgi:hypothetical protein
LGSTPGKIARCQILQESSERAALVFIKRFAQSKILSNLIAIISVAVA